MYIRTQLAIINNPPPKCTCMCKVQFGKACYSEIGFTIPSVIDSSDAFYVIEYLDDMEIKKEESLQIPQATSKGFVEIPPGSIFDGSYPNSKTRRGRLQDGGRLSPTITASGEPLYVYEGLSLEDFPSPRYRIRKLTERECFRLMGVDDSCVDKIQESGISRTQQYKMAGNSIVVDVLYHIFRKMFVETENESQQLSLF